MIPQVFQALNVPAVTSIATGGIHYRKAPQGTSAPYIVWFVVTDTPSNYHSERPGISNFRIQLDLWSRDAATLINLKEAVRAELDSTGQQIIGRDGYDDDTSLHRYTLNYSFWTDV